VWQRYKDQGLVVIGVPSSSFGQELQSEAEIKDFCEANYQVDFPLTERETVRGADAHPFFQWVASQGHNQPSWNFYKYLIGPDGKVAQSWSTRTDPESNKVLKTLEASLPM